MKGFFGWILSNGEKQNKTMSETWNHYIMHGMSFNKLLEVIFKGSAILFSKNHETSMSKDGDKVLTLALKSVSVRWINISLVRYVLFFWSILGEREKLRGL